ncbi:MAG: alpha/beta hydrolase [Alphaproteobacteria bacterium]|nr:alpha/beta hydrolase [Alphaproteobacteria bacterium]
MADPEMLAIREALAANPRPPEVAERRKRLDALGSSAGIASDVQVTPLTIAGRKAEWTRTPTANEARVILFFHGGGYCQGSLESHRHIITEAGRFAASRTLAIDYRLAPEHPFPAGLDDAIASYRFLLEQGIDPKRIAVAGDSAGGGLTVATLVALRDAKLPLPGCAWCISPWVDLEAIGESMTSKARIDPMISKDYVIELAEAYLAGADPRTPLAAPLYADLEGLPPMLVQVGAAETLLDDAVRLAQKAGAADVATTLEIWPEMIHVWHIFHPHLAAGRRAIAAAGAFIGSRLARG